MLGPFATTSRFTPIHQVSPLYCRTPPAHRCPRRQRRRQRQRVTEGTAMAPWNGPNKPAVYLLHVEEVSVNIKYTRSINRHWCIFVTPLWSNIVAQQALQVQDWSCNKSSKVCVAWRSDIAAYSIWMRLEEWDRIRQESLALASMARYDSPASSTAANAR